MFEVGIVRHLPQFMREYPEIAAVCETCDTELAALHSAVSDLWNARSVLNCSEKILSLHEKSLNIAPLGDVYERREAVLMKLNSRAPVTETTVRGMLDFVSGGEYRFLPDKDLFILRVYVPRGGGCNAAAVYKTLRALIPANLALTVDFNRNTYGGINDAGMTYGGLGAYDYDCIAFDLKGETV